MSKEKDIALLINEGYNKYEISVILEVSESEVSSCAKKHGLLLAKQYSIGQREVEEIIETNFPYLKLKSEYYIGTKLHLDIYLESIKLAFEFDGIQHDKYVKFFHGSEDGFFNSLSNDSRKSKLCKQQGIKLVRLSSDLTRKELEDYVISSIQEAIESS